MPRLSLLTVPAAAALLAGCNTYPIVIGPVGLDDEYLPRGVVNVGVPGSAR